MDCHNRVVIDPEILAGKPVIKGTRLTVELIIDLLAQGWTEAEIVRNYPDLTREDIRACLAYAGTILKAEKDKGTDETAPGESLVAFFRRSPLVGIDLDLDRDKSDL